MNNPAHVHIMPDLETLGTSPQSPIIAIGCTIGPELPEFYVKIAITDTVGEIDKNTMLWWLDQSKEAQDETFKNNISGITLRAMLMQFTDWFYRVTDGGTRPYTIYGNAASFDLVLLRESYKAVGFHAPWNFRNESCYRTLKNQFPEIVFAPEAGSTAHCALDDAKNQHEHLMRILDHIDNMKEFYSNGDQII